MRRKSLLWGIAIPYILLILITMGGLGVYLTLFVQDSYLTNLRTNLTGQARILAEQAAPLILQGPPYAEVNALAKRYAKLVNIRTTIILPDGVVIGESEVDLSQLGNHSNRPEVQAALQGREDTQIRTSDTLKEQMLYAAVPIRSGAAIIGIARTSLPINRIYSDSATIQRSIFILFAITAALAMVIALWITNRNITPITRLTQAAEKISLGNFDEIVPATRQDEIGQLGQAFNRMASKLSDQISELQAERGKLAAVLENMSNGILIVDSDGLVQLINPAARKLFQVSPEAPPLQSLVEVVRNHQLVDLWRRTLQTGEIQIATLEAGTDRLFMQGIATPLAPTSPRSTLIVIQDLTRVRQLEMIRRDFVSNVSHELRTPLASLKALTETLQEGALEDPPAAHRFLQQMDNEIDNLTQLVQELLELSKIESGKVPLSRKLISPAEILHSAGERMRMQIERAGLTLAIETEEPLPEINVDAARLEQVLINLIHNSVKFTLPGGKITLRCTKSDNRVLFTVQDTGIGIAPEALPRIFERFYKADRARSGKGTGLGLSIARHTVEAHGGRIWAESTLGEGSTFFVALPVPA